MKANIKKWVKERDEMLKKCDVNELRKFINAHPETYGKEFRNAINKASDDVLKITLHKMIVNGPKLPKDLREKSAFWLISHGYDLNIN